MKINVQIWEFENLRIGNDLILLAVYFIVLNFKNFLYFLKRIIITSLKIVDLCKHLEITYYCFPLTDGAFGKY